jgi:dihydroxyacetone kinase phosphotransfer subunit
VIAIVVVSHSEPLARAAVELATQMVADDPPAMEIAAGSDGGLGTDATAIAAAIQRADDASGGTGVLVMMDLGSAVLSSEMALELVDDLAGEVYLSRAPFVEGLVAAAVQAALGRSVADVEREAVKAVGAKADQLGEDAVPGAGAAVATPEGEFLDVEVINPQGLHARPAAQIATAVGALAAEVEVEAGGRRADAASSLELMTLAAGQGTEITVSATGADAEQAIATVSELVLAGFGELEAS